MTEKRQRPIFSKLIKVKSDSEEKVERIIPQRLPMNRQESPSEPVIQGFPESPKPLPEPSQAPDRAMLQSDASPQSAEEYPRGSKTQITAMLANTMVLIEPGSFLMGSPEHEPGRNEDETAHEVKITSPFYLQKIHVTQLLWKAVMGWCPSFFKDLGEMHPVEGVSWEQCQEFIECLNALVGYSYRLPSEAEWEYACRAGSHTAFCAGRISRLYCDRDKLLDPFGWYCGNSERTLHAVGLKSANRWGLHDMHGNLWEWCQDWYGPYPEEAVTDPTGPSSGIAKVVRGGSWFSNAKNCRSASRFKWSPDARSDMVGFRLARDA